MIKANRNEPGYATYKNLSMPKYNVEINRSPSKRATSVNKNKQIASNSKLGSNIRSNSTNSTTPKTFSYYLGKGNNQGLIRRVLGCRATWLETDDSTSAFLNLKWQQDQKGFRYNRLKDSPLYRGVLNQFEFHENLSNKEYLFRNMQFYCQKKNIDLWKIIPPTYVLNVKDECNMQFLKSFVDSYEKYYPKKLKEKAIHDVDKQIYDIRQKLKKYFFNCNLKKNVPKSPPIKGCYLDEQQGEYLWIVKPTFLNRGRGIQVFSKLEDLNKYVIDNIHGYVQKVLASSETKIPEKNYVDYIKKNSENIMDSVLQRDPNQRQYRQKKQQEINFDGNQYIRVIPKGPSTIKTDRFLIQKYLQKPLLIKNHKFDMRIWVLVTQNMKCYVFKEGYIRLSSMEYTSKDTKDNNFMHLTNNAVQKFSQGYGQIADGNQLSYKELKEVMQQNNLSFGNCRDKIYEFIQISLSSSLPKLNPDNRKFCFQIFGYDFMIDKEGQPYLIEINNNPCIQESSKLLEKLIPRMLDDAFRLTIDMLFFGSVSNGKFPVEGYGDRDNMWHLLNTTL